MYKMCSQNIYLIYMYKQDLTLNNQNNWYTMKPKPNQTNPNQTKLNQTEPNSTNKASFNISSTSVSVSLFNDISVFEGYSMPKPCL